MVKAWLEDQMLDISAAPNIWALHHEKKDPDATDNHDDDDEATNEHCWDAIVAAHVMTLDTLDRQTM